MIVSYTCIGCFYLFYKRKLPYCRRYGKDEVRRLVEIVTLDKKDIRPLDRKSCPFFRKTQLELFDL